MPISRALGNKTPQGPDSKSQKKNGPFQVLNLKRSCRKPTWLAQGLLAEQLLLSQKEAGASNGGRGGLPGPEMRSAGLNSVPLSLVWARGSP